VSQLKDLIEAERLVVAEFERGKWSKVAVQLKGVHEGKEWNARFLAKTFSETKKGGLGENREEMEIEDFDKEGEVDL
jgi:hypothetical protein